LIHLLQKYTGRTANSNQENITEIMSNQKFSFNFILTSEQPTYHTHLYKIQYQLQIIITNSSTLLSNIKLFYLYNKHFISVQGDFALPDVDMFFF